MDPEQCLIDAAAAIKTEGERGECGRLLADYFQWRLKGGFQAPDKGDVRALVMLSALGRVADTLSEALNYRHADR